MPFPQYFTRGFSRIGSYYTGHPFRLLTTCLKTFFIFHVATEYTFQLAGAAGASMLPTFEVKGDWLLIDRGYRRGQNVKVGDIVSFDSVVVEGERVIKRVMGLPGDYVLRDTPGANESMIQVSKGHCWVTGDNWTYSRDSRHFGPMPMALIKGKVIMKISPWSERKWIENGLQPVT